MALASPRTARSPPRIVNEWVAGLHWTGLLVVQQPHNTHGDYASKNLCICSNSKVLGLQHLFARSLKAL